MAFNKKRQFLLYQPYCGLAILGIFIISLFKVRFYIFFVQNDNRNRSIYEKHSCKLSLINLA